MVWAILWLMCPIIAAVVYRGKGRSAVAAFIIGLLLGPVGVLLALLTPTDKAGQEAQALGAGQMKRCPQCAELVRAEAQVCRFCQHSFAPAILDAPLIPDGATVKLSTASGAVCSACKGFVRHDATMCKHCKRTFTSAT